MQNNGNILIDNYFYRTIIAVLAPNSTSLEIIYSKCCGVFSEDTWEESKYEIGNSLYPWSRESNLYMSLDLKTKLLSHFLVLLDTPYSLNILVSTGLTLPQVLSLAWVSSWVVWQKALKKEEKNQNRA